MPLYDYKCAEHGVFHALVEMSASGEAAVCPSCMSLSPRVILFSPALLDMNPEKRNAIAKNERAQHEPKKFNRQEQSHNCCAADKKSPRCFFTADGKKMFPSARPWMISH